MPWQWGGPSESSEGHYSELAVISHIVLFQALFSLMLGYVMAVIGVCLTYYRRAWELFWLVSLTSLAALLLLDLLCLPPVFAVLRFHHYLMHVL